MLRVDPRARRRAQLVLILLALGLAAAMAPVVGWMSARLNAIGDAIREQRDHDADHLLSEVLTAVTVGGNLIGGVAGLVFIMIGLAGMRSGRFPPPGTLLVRDTRLYEKGAARWRSALMLTAGVALIVVNAVMIRMLGQLVQSLAGPPG